MGIGPPNRALDRRRLLQGSLAVGGLGLAGCATTPPPIAQPPRTAIVVPPIRASMARVIDVTVCLRPFRAAGPRLDAEQVGDKLVVHNYGHGGSGWSLSWGSGTLAVQKAMASSPREIAVIGCGALGLTAAILAQSAGAKVTIYARDLIADSNSARATGTWSPDSRIALENAVDPGFPALWEQMARTSFRTFRSWLGLPGEPVEWADRYVVALEGTPQRAAPPPATSPVPFAHYTDRIRDITPARERLPAGATSLPAGARVSRQPMLIFNIAGYGRALMAQFLAAGGRVERTEFHTPADIARLKEPVVINCPGYGARGLWRDESVVPVRGQMTWLIPQPDVHYGLFYNNVSVIGRRDGIGLQDVAGGDMRGYADDNEAPDPAETEGAVAAIAELFGRAPG